MAPERLPASDAALLKSGALQMAEELVAPLALEHGMGDIQIALNLPPYNHRPGGPHIDGHRPEQAEPHSFTMLAAAYLVDESKKDSGNLWVWPGSHLVHQQLFTERGVGVLLPVSGHPTMLNPPVVYSEPTPVYAHRGDLLLAHFLLGHNIGGNLTSEVRRIIYYRLSCRGHGARWAETFLDVFAEYGPVR
jgi:ectoine hydroxylase-related dioxygenase (phytanoyl-CoA dioxygenase family)